jgi:hypothetical protein
MLFKLAVIQIQFMGRFEVRDKTIHRHLQQDLIEHIWERFGHENNHN